MAALYDTYRLVITTPFFDEKHNSEMYMEFGVEHILCGGNSYTFSKELVTEKIIKISNFTCAASPFALGEEEKILFRYEQPILVTVGSPVYLSAVGCILSIAVVNDQEPRRFLPIPRK